MKDKQQRMEENEHIRNQVLEKLAGGPKSFDEIYACIDVLEERQQLSNALFHLKKNGAVAQRDDRLYTLPGKGGSAPAAKSKRAPKAAPGKPPASVPVKRQPKPVAANGSETNRILETLLADAQRALDDYVYSVGDRQILDQLMAARNAARAAFQAYLATGADV